MKAFRINLVLAIGLTVLSAASAQNAAPNVNPETGVPESWPDPAALDFDAVAFAQPEVERAVLSNGLTVYMLEDHALPLVNGAAFVRTGSLYDPEAKASLASLTADLMRTGGSAGRTADELDERLENLAASVEVSAADLYTTATFSALTENLEEVLGLYAGVLTEPAFAPDRIDLAKGRALEGIRRENDDPVGIAVREFYRRLAAGHPAGYVPTAETVGAVTRADMRRFHGRYFKPNETVLAVSGDFERGELLRALERVFGPWRQGEVTYPELPPYPRNPEPRIYHVQRDLGQSIILMGHPSVFAYTPAYNRLDVANAVLGGGGFSSRIFTEIRTRRGLAYSAGSQISQGFAYPGTFLAYAITRTDATGQVIDLLRQQMESMAERPVAPEDLETQKSNTLNGAVFRFTSSDAIVQRVARAAEILNLPAGYFERYIRDVAAATPAQVRRVAEREFRPEEMIVMVVGDAAQFDRPLSSFSDTFGPVEEITLPTP